MRTSRARGHRSARNQLCFASILACAAVLPRVARAQEAPVETNPPPKPAAYSLPFALRPAAAATALRLDTGFAFYEDPTSKNSGSTVAPVLPASYKVLPYLAPLVRLGVV